MPRYVVLLNPDQGARKIKDFPQRLKEATEAPLGGELIDFYATMGEYDFVAIAEAPDDETAMAAAAYMGLPGSVRTTTLRAFSAVGVRCHPEPRGG